MVAVAMVAVAMVGVASAWGDAASRRARLGGGGVGAESATGGDGMPGFASMNCREEVVIST